MESVMQKDRQMRSCKKAARAALGLTAALMMCAVPGVSYAQERHYYQSATYYSDDWVVNFWNSESANMEEELGQIAENGFNSIILVVPWREFQPSVQPVTYQEYAFEKLERVMTEAEKQNLDVFLRVGYTWDYCINSRDNILERYQRLLYDETVREAWKDYVGTIYQAAASHSNFAGGFLTWEDFWNFTETAGRYGNSEESRNMAEKIGYTEWLAATHPLETVSRLYQTEFTGYEEVYLPEAASPAFRLFYEYYDGFLNRLLAESQQVFPGLSMEVRLDVDAVNEVDGGLYGYSHGATFGCQDSGYTSLMYSVAMGQQAGVRTTADEALTMMDQMLAFTSQCSGGKPLYIDQFLYMDNTPGFEHNSQLEEGQISEFLVNSFHVLKNRTKGYGVWTYRDYGNNAVYNSQFGQGKAGWSFHEQAVIKEEDSNKRACLGDNSMISQDLKGDVTAQNGNPVFVSFYAEGVPGTKLQVYLDGRSREISLKEGGQTYRLEFPSGSYRTIRIQNQKEAVIDNVKVYSHVTKGELYNIDGSEAGALEAIRELNRRLNDSFPAV